MHTNTGAASLRAGVCKYEIHEDDLQFEAVKEEYDALPQKDKDR